MHPPKEHFHFGHLGAIALCAALLLGMTFMKNGFHLNFNSAQNQSQRKIVTYEEAVTKVAANYPQASEAESAGQMEEQLALIDPSRETGSVLGASTGDELFPPAEEIFTQEALGKIKIKINPVSNKETLLKYAQQIASIEAYYNFAGMLSALNSEDKTQLATVPEAAKKLNSLMIQIEAPSEAEEYHKLKMIYYVILADIANNFAGKAASADLQSSSAGMFSIMDKLDRIKAEIQNKYQVEL